MKLPDTPRLGNLGAVVGRHRLLSFFACTFAWSWAFWIGLAASGVDESIGITAVVLGAFGPPLAAVAVVWVTGGSVRDWVRTVAPLRVPSRWYGVALALPVAMVFVGALALPVLRIDLAVGELPFRLATFLPTVLFMAVLGGGQEELGWRGFALRGMQQRLSPWMAAFAVGVVWAVWHLPLFYLPGAAQFESSFPIFGLGIVGLSVVFTWLFNQSASVAVVMLLHGSYNAALVLHPVPIEQLTGESAGNEVPLIGAVTAWVVAFALIAITHGDLGYEHSRVRVVQTEDNA